MPELCTIYDYMRANASLLGARILQQYPALAVGSNSTFRQAESSVIIEALRAAAGRIAGKGGAAERLGLKRTTLQNKIRRLGITKVQYQN